MDNEDYSERIKKFGFKPQKECVYNQLLPFSEEIDNEALINLKEIKTNLIKAILGRELRPGFAIWTGRLNQYIKLYGFLFSKEDHINLIKLYYEVLTLKNLEPTRLVKCASMLSILLKKRYLLSRDDLQLDWRPLYNLMEKLNHTTKSDIGIYRYPAVLEQCIRNVIKLSQVYFPAAATREILDEFKPKLCPLNMSDMIYTIDAFQAFLPVYVNANEASISYDLWFSEFMNLWNTCINDNCWEGSMVWLMARLASYNMGHINFDPYVPTMYARFVRSLQLPVHYKMKLSSKDYKIELNAMAMWIIGTLNSKTEITFYHLEKFMQMIRSYLYTANSGRWSSKLKELLNKLTTYFCNRIYIERRRPKSWENEVPEDFKLMDSDIDRFVIILRPSLELAMFSRRLSNEVSFSFQNLASIRPNLIIPMVVEKLYASLDSLVEPHKLISAMSVTISIARYMAEGAKMNYPEGPTHIIPLLMAVLPGIDPNDFRKCFTTFHFITQFVCMIPIINSSQACNHYDDLTEEEHAVCEATAGFEDFILQFFDRVCTWIESCSLDFIRPEQNSETNFRGGLEFMSEHAMASVITIILRQCSTELFVRALKKVFKNLTQNVLEIDVSGRLAAFLCGCFAKVNPKETLKIFIPYLCDKINGLIDENPSIKTEENVDGELLYNMLILSEVVDGRNEILLYMDYLMELLDKVLFFSSPQALRISNSLLIHLVFTLTSIQPLERKSSDKSYDLPVKEFLSIREWAIALKPKDVKVQWYIPGEKETRAVQSLVDRYVVPVIEQLNSYSDGNLVLSRVKLRQLLKIINAILASNIVLPIWEEPHISLQESVTSSHCFVPVEMKKLCVKMPGEKNLKKVVADTLHKVQKKVLQLDEGDTKSIYAIISIYNYLLHNKVSLHDVEQHWKNFSLIKKITQNRVLDKKRLLRHLIIDRAALQQMIRIEQTDTFFTETHKQIVFDLFDLSVSRYRDVRVYAQMKLTSFLGNIPYSYNLLKTKILEILRLNSDEHHEKLKGCLYLLISPKNVPLITKQDWEYISDLWPAIVNSMPSEKVSIINLITHISESVHTNFPTITIDFKVPENITETALLLNNNAPICDINLFNDISKNSEKRLQLDCENRRKYYNMSIERLLNACNNSNLHWRYHLLAMGFLRDIVHPDLKFNTDVVKYFLQTLLHESLLVRKISLKMVVYILIQNKPNFKKIEIDTESFLNASNEGFTHKNGGMNEDNKCLLYNQKMLPKTSEEWNKTLFLHDASMGFYAWPKKIKIYAPPNEQPSIADNKSKMNEHQLEIYEFFSNEGNISKLVYFLTLEDKKDKDQFSVMKSLIFKYLSKLLEDKVLDIFVPHIEKLATEKLETSQRCATEMMAGIIRGSKHWSFEKVEKMWHTLIPIIHEGNENILTETIRDWTCCLCLSLLNRDSRSYYWLIEFLLDDPLADPTSFIACARLHLLNNTLNQQSWRNSELYERLLQYLKQYLTHPFQNIRKKISDSLKITFIKDFSLPGSTSSSFPSLETYLNDFLTICDDFYDDILKEVEINEFNDNIIAIEKNLSKVKLNNIIEGGLKKEEAEKLFKILGSFIVSTLICRMTLSTPKEFYRIVPLACLLHNKEEEDDEIQVISINILALLSQTIISINNLPLIFNYIDKVINCPLWSARYAITEFLATFVFHNFAVLLNEPKWVQKIESIALVLLEDPQPEVREISCKFLSGLLHCNFLPLPLELLQTFKIKAKSKLKKNKQINNSPNIYSNNLIQRHAGVLGLCAFINASPYEVPDFLPDIFALLGPHLNDPLPIPASIRKTLCDFKRTHQDNWEVHKAQFTEDELSVLQDLVVPPSYYV